LIAGNWKMHKTIAEAEAFVSGLLPRIATAEYAEIAVCAPFTALQAIVDSTRGTLLETYAQNVHQEASGAYTGEISIPMIDELDVHGSVIGHSERREYFNETDEALSAKAIALLEANLKVILCVGETDGEREAGETEAKLRRQVEQDLASVPDARLGEIVVAYEPIWAIGTGKVATPEQAQEACAFVRSVIAERSADEAQKVRVLYGGSVKPDNAAELLALPDVDGALVGGASLQPEDFAAIIEGARP
jgi:triosephosphate isomerase